MITLIVTGGIAMGKSTAVRQLQDDLAASFHVFDADACVAKLLTEPDIAGKISSEFGESALSPDGSVNRPFLRDQVFDSVQRRAALEGILHPQVRRRFEVSKGDAVRNGSTVLVADIPLFFESKSPYPCDCVLVVAADPVSQRRRLLDRRGITPDIAEKIVAAQLPIEQKIDRADATIWNAGRPQQLITQIQFFTTWLKTKM